MLFVSSLSTDPHLLDFSWAGTTAGSVNPWTTPRTRRLSGLSTWPGSSTSLRLLTWPTQWCFSWRRSTAISPSSTSSITASCPSTAGGVPGQLRTILRKYFKLVIRFVGGGQSGFGAFLNAGVHTVMYLYYFLATFGPEIQKYLWWKKWVAQDRVWEYQESCLDTWLACRWPSSSSCSFTLSRLFTTTAAIPE